MVRHHSIGVYYQHDEVVRIEVEVEVLLEIQLVQLEYNERSHAFVVSINISYPSLQFENSRLVEVCYDRVLMIVYSSFQTLYHPFFVKFSYINVFQDEVVTDPLSKL